VRHAITDIKDFKYSETASSFRTRPMMKEALSSLCLPRFHADERSEAFRERPPVQNCRTKPQLRLESQNTDGSWPYARDGVRNFVDHFHTCL